MTFETNIKTEMNDIQYNKTYTHKSVKFTSIQIAWVGQKRYTPLTGLIDCRLFYIT